MNKASGWFPGGSVYNPPSTFVQLLLAESDFCPGGGVESPQPLANPALIPTQLTQDPSQHILGAPLLLNVCWCILCLYDVASCCVITCIPCLFVCVWMKSFQYSGIYYVCLSVYLCVELPQCMLGTDDAVNDAVLLALVFDTFSWYRSLTDCTAVYCCWSVIHSTHATVKQTNKMFSGLLLVRPPSYPAGQCSWFQQLLFLSTCDQTALIRLQWMKAAEWSQHGAVLSSWGFQSVIFLLRVGLSSQT